MRGYAVRTIIGIVCFLLFIYVLPLLLDVLGINLAANAMQLIKVCAAVITLGYIAFGRYPVFPPAT
jgi:hypothetical protein